MGIENVYLKFNFIIFEMVYLKYPLIPFRN